MNSPSPARDKLSALAATIEGLDGLTIYGRVPAVRGLLVEISGPIGAIACRIIR